jgi:hypothetical protein
MRGGKRKFQDKSSAEGRANQLPYYLPTRYSELLPKLSPVKAVKLVESVGSWLETGDDGVGIALDSRIRLVEEVLTLFTLVPISKGFLM